MGVTLTDVLLFGKAQSDDIDNATLVIYRRNILRWSALGGYLDIIVKGVSPLSLPDAIANSLSYVKAFGGTEQRNLPDGYTQLEYIESTGTQYIDTGFTWETSTKIDFTIERLGDNAGQTSGTSRANVWFGANGNTGSENMLGWGASGNSNYFRGSAGSSTYILPLNTKTNITFDYTKGAMKLFADGVQRGGIGASTNTVISKILLGGVVDNASPYIIYCLERFYGSVKMWNGSELVANFIPAKRNSDSVIGMYDTVSGTFFTNAGTGTFSAGGEAVPTPDTPMDIVSNNGVLKARHQSGLPLGYQKVESLTFTSGAYIITDIYPNQDTEFIVDVKKNADNLTWLFGTRNYPSTTSPSTNKFSLQGISSSSNTLWLQLDNTTRTEYNSVAVTSTQTERLARHTLGIKNKRIYMDGEVVEWGIYGVPDWSNFTALNPLVIGGNYEQAGGVTGTFSGDLYGATGLILCKRLSDNVSGVYNPTTGNFFPADGTGTITAGNPVSDPVEVYADGTVETIKDSLNNTATAEMLLKVGDYQDVQSILDGVVNRQLGVFVLDGTENWAYSSGYSDTATNACFYIPPQSVTIPILPQSASTVECLCSHFRWVSRNEIYNNQTPIVGAITGSSTETRTGASITLRVPLSVAGTTPNNFKQWLADQYAAGTPVIVIYPLATPTTESVAGQTLQVTDGDNVLEITQASLNGLELEAQYQAAVSLTIQEVQDANLDPNVEVTIN